VLTFFIGAFLAEIAFVPRREAFGKRPANEGLSGVGRRLDESLRFRQVKPLAERNTPNPMSRVYQPRRCLAKVVCSS
jgi:hypothetical protein